MNISLLKAIKIWWRIMAYAKTECEYASPDTNGLTLKVSQQKLC